MTMTDAEAGTSKRRPRKRSRKSRTKTEDGGEDTSQIPIDVPSQQQASSSRLPTSSPSNIASASALRPPPAAKLASSKNGASQHPTASSSSSQPPSILSSNPHKPSVLPRPSIHGPRKYSLSVAFPSSIVLNAQTMELKTRLVGSIARICAVFNVDEIIVFNDGASVNDQGGDESWNRKRSWRDEEEEAADKPREAFDPDSFVAMILQYLETPQYLRKQLFPMHPNLRLAGLLPPLDCPHHVRFEDESPYREGLVVEQPHYSHDGSTGNRPTVWVNVGFRDAVQCYLSGKDTEVPPMGARVTVELPAKGRSLGTIVSPRTPVQSKGLYWGYSVRLASSLSQVFTSCPFSSPMSAASEEYDLVIGTAERGDSLTDILYATQTSSPVASSKDPSQTVQPLPSAFSHALILFGGLSGLEVAIERDEGIPLGRGDARELCDVWCDVVEGQGSRTVRTEEAITITLARLKTVIEQSGTR